MVTKMNKLNCWVFTILMLLALTVNADEIQVSVDRNPVSLNDSFRIIFSSSHGFNDDPDLSPLQENFEILDQQHSSNSSWVNGHSTSSDQWIISVLAKQSGELLIPPVAFGKDISKPLKITVSNSQNLPQGDEDLMLEVEASPEKPYVQSQVLYTLRFYRRVPITQARLEEPQIKDAVVEKLGDDSTFNTQLNGVDYVVTERKYAIFPQQSGVFTIQPITVNADVLIQRRPRFNGFFNLQNTDTRRVVSKAVTLNVQAVPAGINSDEWLAADSLEISEEWSDKTMQTKVGEPLTRTVRLSAKGTTVGQLPELAKYQAIDGIKTYADQPVLKEDKQADGLTAYREEKIAFIPSKPGNYTLPALHINWFNTKTQHMEKVSLPSITIKALVNNELNAQQPAAPAQQTPFAAPVESADNTGLRFWQYLSAGLALGWLLTVIVFMLKKPKLPAQPAPLKQAVEKVPESVIEKALKQACLENDSSEAKQQLLLWGKQQFGADSLGGLAKHCNEQLSNEIEKLNQSLYSVRHQTWDGSGFWQVFVANQPKAIINTQQDDGLQPLYKI